MNRVIAVLGGIGVGAALMFLYDPRGGRRRRALIRDKAVGLSNDARRSLGKTTRDLGHRAQGMMHKAKMLVAGAEHENAEQTGQAV
jgi:hypothetical protein